MGVIISIQGRDAIPIRAIPFLTEWTVLAPLELANSLSKKGGSGEIHGLTSFRLDGVDVKPIKPSWWLDASVAVDSIHEVAKAKNASYRGWQLAAIEALPETAFVWLDELEVCFSQSFLDQDSDHASEELENLKQALLGLNFSPFIERDMLALVMQGFQHLVRPAQTATPALVVDKSASIAPVNGITTAQVAAIFDGHHYTAENWIKRLSGTKWLVPARVALGAAGGATSLWCPTKLAQLIHGKQRGAQKQKTLETLNRKFKNIPELAPWRTTWDEHYDMFNDADANH